MPFNYFATINDGMRLITFPVDKSASRTPYAFNYEPAPDGGREQIRRCNCRHKVPEACSLCVTRMAQVTRTTECIRARIHSHACVYKPLKAARSLVVSLKILWRKEERSFKAIRVGVNILHASIRTDGWTARYVNADSRVIRPSPILFDKNHLPLRNCENCEAFHTFRTFLSWCKNLHATNCQIILYVYKTRFSL